MSEQQWAVMRGERGAWIVSTPDHTDRDDDGRLICWDVDSIHDTWTEAMQEADRMARTVTVTLPRVEGTHALPLSSKAPKEDPILVRRYPHVVSIRYSAQGNINTLYLFPDELEPVALALLAHARKETD